MARAAEVVAIVVVFGLGVFLFNYNPAWWLLAIFLLMVTDDRRYTKKD